MPFPRYKFREFRIQDKKFIEAYLLVNYFEKVDSYIKNFEMNKKYTEYLNYSTFALEKPI